MYKSSKIMSNATTSLKYNDVINIYKSHKRGPNCGPQTSNSSGRLRVFPLR